MNLTGAPRQELINTIRRLATERDRARRAAAYWHERAGVDGWRHWTAEQVRREAEAIMATLPADKDAADRRRVLLYALDEHRAAQPWAAPARPRRVVPRCGKGHKPCGKPLRPDGLCSRHDFRTIRALREQAA